MAVVVPSLPRLRALAGDAHSAATLQDLCKDPELRGRVLDSLTETAKASKLKGFEIVRALALEPEPFSVENDLLTPTFKLKRPQLQKRYQDVIDAMYKSPLSDATFIVRN